MGEVLSFMRSIVYKSKCFFSHPSTTMPKILYTLKLIFLPVNLCSPPVCPPAWRYVVDLILGIAFLEL